MATEVADAYLALYARMPGVKGEIEKSLGASDVQTATKKAGESIGNRFMGAVGGIVNGTATAVVGAAAAGIGIALTKGFARLQAIDTARMKLTGLGHDATAVDAIMANALNSVRGTAFGLGEAATTAAGAVAAGIAPGAELERVLKSVTNTAAAAGVGMDEMGSIYNKVASIGKAQNDVLQQVADRGIPIYQALASQLGVTTDEVFKMASAGKIGFGEFESAMTSAAGTIAEQMGKTVSGSLSNFFASLGRVGANLMSGFFPKIAPLIQSTTAALAPLEEKAASLGAAIGERLAPFLERVTQLLQGGMPDLSRYSAILGPATAAFVALGASGLAPLISLIPGLGGFAGALGALSNPVALVAAGIGGLIAVSPELREAVGGAFGALAEAGGQVATAAQPALEQLLPAVLDLVAAFGGGLAVALTAAASIITSITPTVVWLTSAIADNLQVVAVIAGAYAAFRVASATVGILTAAQSAYTAATYGAAGASYAATAATNAQALAARAGAAAHALMNSAVVTATTSWFANTAAIATNSSLTLGARAAMIAASVGTGIATAAQWALNAAMSANPIGIIIVAIGALVAAIVWVATQTTFFQDAWEALTTGLAIAWEWLWGSVIEPGINGLVIAFQAVVGFLQPVFDWFTGVINGIVAVFTWWITNITIPLINGVVAVFQWLVAAVTPIFQIIGALIQIAGAAFVWLYNNAVKPALDWIGMAITAFGLGMQILWATYVQPVINAIGAAFNWVYANVIQPVANWIAMAVTALGITVQALWSAYVQPALNAVAAGFQWVWANIIQPISGWISGAIGGIGDTVGRVFNVMGSIVANAFNGVVSTVKRVFNNIIDLVNGAIGGIDDVISTVGGALGVNVSIGRIPKLAEGAIVNNRPGGILANIGEGRYPEAVTPLAGPQFRKMAQAIHAESGQPARRERPAPPIHVHTNDPMLAATVVADQLRRR